jgi:hypothetical protein
VCDGLKEFYGYHENFNPQIPKRRLSNAEFGLQFPHSFTQLDSTRTPAPSKLTRLLEWAGGGFDVKFTLSQLNSAQLSAHAPSN